MTPRSVMRSVIGGLALALGLTLFIDVALLVVPIYDMQLYDRVLMSHNMDTLAMLSVACVVGLLFYGAFEMLRSACFVTIAAIVTRRLHGPALEQGIRRAATGDKHAGPQVVRDVSEIGSFLGSGAVAVPLDAVCAPMFIIVLFMLHPAFGYLAIFGIAGLILANAVTEWLVHPVLHHAQERRRAAGYALSANVSDVEVTDGLGMLPAIARRWVARHSEALAALSRAASRAQLVGGVSRLFRLFLQAAVMALGAVLIIRGHTTPGCLMGANLMVNKCLLPFDHLVESCRSWVGARGAGRRIAAVLSSELMDQSVAMAGEAEPGLLVRGADLSLPGGSVLLRDIDLVVAPGTFAVVTGPNGGGKTSLLRMLAGVAAPSRGRVLLDGAVVRGGQTVGYLPQSVSLMEGSVGENIARMQDAGGELTATLDAARLAGVHELVGRMARGYETPLTGDGSALSGGMRQRIGLARAVYGAPRLLLLDEPDASLDGEGTKALVGAIRACCARGAIAIVISHRPAMRPAADLAITVGGGRVVAQPVAQASIAVAPVMQLARA